MARAVDVGVKKFKLVESRRVGAATTLSRHSSNGFSIAALLVVTSILIWLLLASHHEFLDLEVYRAGGATWLAGLPLYAAGFPAPLPGPALPFTYPPISAVLYSLLAQVDLTVAVFIATLVSISAIAVVALITIKDAGLVRIGRVQAVGIVVIFSVVLEPLRSTLEFGQINAYLMALVFVDCFVVPRKYRGILVGVAASLKLIPAGFVLFFFIERDWKSIVRAGASFGSVTVLGFILAPADSIQFWTKTLSDSSRIGDPGWATNQSIMGLLARLGVDGAARTIVWAACAGVLAWLVYLGGRNLLQAGYRVLCVVLVSVWCLLVSPVSWSHHWIWVAPALLAVFGADQFSLRRRIALGAVILAIFTLAPLSWSALESSPGRPWNAFELLYGNLYVWAGLASILATSVAPLYRLLRSQGRRVAVRA